MVIADLAARYQLPALAPLSRYGSWKTHLPHLRCGKKRGFSYFRHHRGEPYTDTPDHEASLLVAASSSEEQSDTHWLRADVDAWLFEQAQAAGGLDASGTAGVLGATLGLRRQDAALETHTSAIFSHFRNAGSWDAQRLAAGDASTIAPFRSDDAAQHHLLEHGWLWMLRFDDGLTSVGLIEPGNPPDRTANLDHLWRELLRDYPSLWSLLESADPVQPLAAMGPLQRAWSHASGPGWAMLPTTAGFVDPLHSTGIAHAVHGVARVADLLLTDRHASDDWLTYGTAVCDEIRWIDQLVSAAYVTMGEPRLFRAACTLFFLATIRFEQTAKAGTPPHACGFLAADASPLRRDLTAARNTLLRAAAGVADVADTLASLHESLQRYDTAGLFNPSAANRFAHTAPR
jgi:FADH2 O2-dependent halogenase